MPKISILVWSPPCEPTQYLQGKVKTKQDNNPTPAQSHLKVPSVVSLGSHFDLSCGLTSISSSYLGVSEWTGSCTQWKRLLRAIFVTMSRREAAVPSSWPTSLSPLPGAGAARRDHWKGFSISNLLAASPSLNAWDGGAAWLLLTFGLLDSLPKSKEQDVWTVGTL